MVHHLPQVFLMTSGDGKSLDQMMGKSLQKMSLKNTSCFFSCRSYEMLSIWANEWMTELPPFKMGWKVYRRELWQVPSFMDHMLFFLLFFYPIGDASMKFFSVSVCSPLGLLNILKTQSCSPRLCRFIWTPGMVSGNSPVDREQPYGSNKCVPKVYAFEFVTL